MFKLLLSLILFGVIHTSTVINRYDECDCHLDPKLRTEIKSYKSVIENIMGEIKRKYGKEMYKEYEHFIDKFGPRLSGSAVLEQAIDYMVNLTRVNGINDVITEEVEVPHWVRIYENVSMLEPRHKQIPILGFGSSVSTPPEGITAEAIVIKSFEELNSTDEAKIKGKIVVFDADYVSYGTTVVYRTQGASKAAKKGAVATLVKSITPFSLYTPHAGYQHYDDETNKIPTAAITIEDADLFRRLQDDGEQIVLHLAMTYAYDTRTSRNTVVDLKGKTSDRPVIVSGHIDSWDVGQGAMDDGGGMFISWFVPIVIKKLNLNPKRTLRAILWTGEEMGLVGAASYLKQHEKELDNINFIMESDEGTFKPTGLDVAGSKDARCIIAEVLKQFTPIDKMTESGGPGSDIVLFIRKGVPGASLLNKNEKYFWFHHSSADMLNVQNKDDVIECAAFWAAVSYVIANLSVDMPR